MTTAIPVHPPTHTSTASSSSPNAASEIIPLDSPLRTTPIHPLLPEIRLPSSPLKPLLSPTNDTTTTTGTADAATATIPARETQPAHPVTLNPLTLQPFSAGDLRAHGLEELLERYARDIEGAGRERERVAREVRVLVEAGRERERAVEREIEEREKVWEVERKVWEKKRREREREGGGG